MELQQYDRFFGTFKPRRTDDLREGAEAYIGCRLLWDAAYVISEDDGGPYVGEFACVPVHERNLPFVWAPHGDLTDLRLTRRISLPA